MPMTTEGLLGKLCAMVAEQADLDASAVHPQSDLFNDLNFDSLDAVEFTMRLEEEFDVSIEDEQVQRIRTPQQAFDALSAMLAAKAS